MKRKMYIGKLDGMIRNRRKRIYDKEIDRIVINGRFVREMESVGENWDLDENGNPIFIGRRQSILDRIVSVVAWGA